MRIIIETPFCGLRHSGFVAISAPYPFMAHLELDHFIQHYGSHTVVDDVSFRVEAGSIACLLGPSGWGKTTLLRCIAGFESIVDGEIRVEGNSVTRSDFRRPPEKRRIGMVFHDYALFPHLTVAANIAFGLSELPARERQTRVYELLGIIGLANEANQYPHELSSEQQQRVALARALAPHPQLILLDEPLSNLDVDLRECLSIEVRNILKSQGMTVVLVTHDQHEAFAMADEIGIMFDGKIQQWNSPYNFHHRPSKRFVANSVGRGVFLPGSVIDSKCVEVELGQILSFLPHECIEGGDNCGHGCHVAVLLRPDDVIHDDARIVQAEVMNRAFRDAEFIYTLRLDSGAEILSLVPSYHNHAIGERIDIRLDVEHVIAFRSERATPRAVAQGIRFYP